MKISEKDGFNWLEPLKTHVKNNEVTSVILVAEKEMRNGLMGLTNCLRKEPGGERIRLDQFLIRKNSYFERIALVLFVTQMCLCYG